MFSYDKINNPAASDGISSVSSINNAPIGAGNITKRNLIKMNQHKVPQWLIKNFALDREKTKVHFLSSSFSSTEQEKELLDATQERSIKKVFSVRDIHKFNLGGEVRDFEGCFSFLQDKGIIIKNIIERGEISLGNKAQISALIYSLLVEELLMEFKSLKPIKPWRPLNNTIKINNEEELQSDSLKEVLKTISVGSRGEDIKTYFAPMIKRIDLQNYLIFNYDWSVLKTEPTSHNFVIGDKPLLLIQPLVAEHWTAVVNYGNDQGFSREQCSNLYTVMQQESKQGIRRAVLHEFGITTLLTKDYIKQFNEIIFPISPKIALHLKQNKVSVFKYSSVEDLEKDINKVNKIQVINHRKEATNSLNYMMYWQCFDGVASSDTKTLKNIIIQYRDFKNNNIVKELKKRKRTDEITQYFVDSIAEIFK